LVFCQSIIIKCKKTNYILFGNKKTSNIPISINNEQITRVFETKFLGIIVQADLKWNMHINSLANKISKTIGVINKLKPVLAAPHLRLLYQSLIEPYISYCCIVWASPEKHCSLETLFKLQKRAVRTILSVHYLAHSAPLFQKLSILNIYLLCLNQILIFVYKSTNFLLPSHCANYFTRTKDIHSHATRGHQYDLFLTNAQKNCRINSLSIRGPRYWNSIPVYIRTATSLRMFKNHLKQYLITTTSSNYT
jgi:hypothetical protein